MKINRSRLLQQVEELARIGAVDDSSDTRVFFCILSQEALGPDGTPVSPTECTPDRRCFCKGRAASSGG